jgi:hypothetical protein
MKKIETKLFRQILILVVLALSIGSCEKEDQYPDETTTIEIDGQDNSSTLTPDLKGSKRSSISSISISIIQHNRKVSEGVRFKINDIPSPYDKSPWQVKRRTMYTYYVDFDSYPSGKANYEGFSAEEGTDYWVFPTSPGKLSVRSDFYNLSTRETITIYSNEVSYNIQPDASLNPSWVFSGSICAWEHSYKQSRRLSVSVPPPYPSAIGYNWFGGNGKIEWTQDGFYVANFETLSNATFPSTFPLYSYFDNNTSSVADDRLYYRALTLQNCVYIED